MLEIPEGTVALLFDCDGTLADTMTLHFEAWHETLLVYGIDCPRTFIDEHAGVPTDLIVDEVNDRWGVALDPLKISTEKEGRFREQIHRTEPVEEVLATAHAYHGKLPMAVVSGGVGELVRATLVAIDALKLFEVIVTADDPVKPKPSPDIFIEAARQLGVDPAGCHVFEDGDPGIVAAKAAGMTFTDVREVIARRSL
jgi:HAD superfamily hydrolase (TIGR01509 family)